MPMMGRNCHKKPFPVIPTRKGNTITKTKKTQKLLLNLKQIS